MRAFRWMSTAVVVTIVTCVVVPAAHADTTPPTIPAPVTLQVVDNLPPAFWNNQYCAIATVPAAAGALGVVFVTGTDPVPTAPSPVDPRQISPLGTEIDADGNVTTEFCSVVRGSSFAPFYVAAYTVGADGATLSTPTVQSVPVITRSDTVPGPLTSVAWTSQASDPALGIRGTAHLSWAYTQDIIIGYIAKGTGPASIAADVATPPTTPDSQQLPVGNYGTDLDHAVIDQPAGTPMTYTVFGADKTHTHYTRTVITFYAGVGSAAKVSLTGPSSQLANAVTTYRINARQDQPGTPAVEGYTPYIVQTTKWGGAWVTRASGYTNVQGLASWTSPPAGDGQAVRVILANRVVSNVLITKARQGVGVAMNLPFVRPGTHALLYAAVTSPAGATQVIQRCVPARTLRCWTYAVVRAVSGKITARVIAPSHRGSAYYYRVVLPARSPWAPAVYSPLVKITAR